MSGQDYCEQKYFENQAIFEVNSQNFQAGNLRENYSDNFYKLTVAEFAANQWETLVQSLDIIHVITFNGEIFNSDINYFKIIN